MQGTRRQHSKSGTLLSADTFVLGTEDADQTASSDANLDGVETSVARDVCL